LDNGEEADGVEDSCEAVAKVVKIKETRRVRVYIVCSYVARTESIGAIEGVLDSWEHHDLGSYATIHD
jgi:hypothetical protein